MQHIRAIRPVIVAALLVGAEACDEPMPATHPTFDAMSPPSEPRTDWGRVDPELRAAGIRLHVDIDGAGRADDSLGDVHKSLDGMAEALDHLPAGAEAPRVASATRHIRDLARRLEGGTGDREERRALVKDALNSAAWAMLGLAGYKYALDPGVNDRVVQFRERVEAIDAPQVGIRLDVYEALLGGRDALDGFLFAIANGNVRP